MRVAARLALIVALVVPVGVPAQAPDSAAIAGTWEGTLGGALRLVLRITRADDGLLLGSLQSLDQGGAQMPVTRIEVKDARVVFAIESVGGSFEGELAGTTLTGTWSQLGRSTPLTFTRATQAAPAASANPGPAANKNAHFVRLQLPDGSTAFYAHLQPGSLRVKDGDRVTRGQVLGLVGNTGNSTEPHLHFHMGGGDANWLAAEGIPYLIDAFDSAPEYGTWIPRRNEMPLRDTVVRFGTPVR